MGFVSVWPGEEKNPGNSNTAVIAPQVELNLKKCGLKKREEKKNHGCLLSKLSKRLHMPKNGNGGAENESADGFWIRNFFFSVTSVHMYPVNPAYKSALQSGIFLNALRIWNRVDARSRFVLNSEVTRSTPVLCREYSSSWCRALGYLFFTSWTSVLSLTTRV